MLTEKTIAAARAADKDYRLWDEGGGGLYLDVKTTGRKVWRMSCRIAGKDVLLTFGRYDPAHVEHVSLKRAREHRDDARKAIRDGKDPREERHRAAAAVKSALNPDEGDRLKPVALAYLDAREGQDAKSKHQDQRRLETYIFPFKIERLGGRKMGEANMRDLQDRDLLAALRAIEAMGRQPLAHKIKSLCSGIWKYGKHEGKCDSNIVTDLAGMVKRGKKKHFASVQEPRRIGALLRAIDGYDGQPETLYALRLAPHFFLRPKPLTHLEWSWIDFDREEIRVPESIQKKRRPHVIPLTRQAIVLLRELHELTADRSKYLFPGLRTPTRPISNGTLNAALRRMGYSKMDQTTHGFRSIADTHLHELGYAHAMIKVQMSHLATEDDTDEAYNYAQYLNDPNTGRKPRAEMMQAWADYLDKLRGLALRSDPNTNNVVPLTAA